MYIIISVVIVCAFVFFWQIIYTIVSKYINNASKSSNTIVGNLWFIGLLIINIVIIGFIYIFYYNKINEVGNVGVEGKPGYAGIQGDGCSIKNAYCD